VVCIFSRLWTGQARVQFLAGARYFSILQNVETGSRAHLIATGGGLFLKVKWLELEVDHLTPSSVDMKNERSYACAPLVCFHSMHRDNATFFCLPISVR